MSERCIHDDLIASRLCTVCEHCCGKWRYFSTRFMADVVCLLPIPYLYLSSSSCAVFLDYVYWKKSVSSVDLINSIKLKRPTILIT